MARAGTDRSGLRQFIVAAAVGGLLLTAPAGAADKRKGGDPNEKVCEIHQVLGSRLAVRKVCATRAEWAERRQRERDIVDRTQVQRCVADMFTGLCSR